MERQQEAMPQKGIAESMRVAVRNSGQDKQPLQTFLPDSCNGFWCGVSRLKEIRTFRNRVERVDHERRKWAIDRRACLRRVQEEFVSLNAIPTQCGRIAYPQPAIAKKQNQRPQTDPVRFVWIHIASLQDARNFFPRERSGWWFGDLRRFEGSCRIRWNPAALMHKAKECPERFELLPCRNILKGQDARNRRTESTSKFVMYEYPYRLANS